VVDLALRSGDEHQVDATVVACIVHFGRIDAAQRGSASCASTTRTSLTEDWNRVLTVNPSGMLFFFGVALRRT
jgi:NAD(P)-dependent dehydrogenase (short-subunit alcohol dehydrogenase family)